MRDFSLQNTPIIMIFYDQLPCKNSRAAMTIEVHWDQQRINIAVQQIKHIANNILDSSAPKRGMQKLTSVEAVILELHEDTVVTIPKLLSRNIISYVLNQLNVSKTYSKKMERKFVVHRRYFNYKNVILKLIIQKSLYHRTSFSVHQRNYVNCL